MKKTIYVAALAALFSLSSISAYAKKSQGDTDNKAAVKEQQQTTDKAAKREGFNPFAGIDLTADQKAKLQDLRKDEAKARQEMRQQAADDKKKAKEDKQKVREDGRKFRAQKLAKIKEILTPDQYVQFLENSWLKAKSDTKAFGRKVERKDRNSKDARRTKTRKNNSATAEAK